MGVAAVIVALVAVVVGSGAGVGGDRDRDRDLAGGGDVGQVVDGANRGLGVQAAGVDSAARRGAAQAANGLELVKGPPEDRGPSVEVEQPEPGEPVVTPPVVPSADAIAEGEEVLAAQPGAKAALEAWLAGQRPGVRTRCWNGDELPESTSFRFEVTYSAEGKLLAYSMNDRGAPGPVRRCVEELNLTPPEIEGPGIPVTVTGALTLP